MEPNEEVKVDVNDESALDKELEESISSLKVGKEVTTKVETQVETKEGEKPTEVKTETADKSQVVDEQKGDDYEFRVPNKGKFESDESYEKRIELLDLVKRRKSAKSDEQKQQISDQINKTKSQIKNLNGSDKIINPLNTEVKVENAEEDEALKADRERLKELGGATKEDIQNIIKETQLASEVKSTLDSFVGRHNELKDEDTREVFFDFVDQNFNWEGKSGKALMTVLELARESMFKPSETIQERVLKGANVQEKVNAMQFPGGTIAKQAYSPEIKKSIDEMVATGMSEEKALELLSE